MRSGDADEEIVRWDTVCWMGSTRSYSGDLGIESCMICVTISYHTIGAEGKGHFCRPQAHHQRYVIVGTMLGSSSQRYQQKALIKRETNLHKRPRLSSFPPIYSYTIIESVSSHHQTNSPGLACPLSNTTELAFTIPIPLPLHSHGPGP